jgi:hypothetical protein
MDVITKDVPVAKESPVYERVKCQSPFKVRTTVYPFSVKSHRIQADNAHEPEQFDHDGELSRLVDVQLNQIAVFKFGCQSPRQHRFKIRAGCGIK